MIDVERDLHRCHLLPLVLRFDFTHLSRELTGRFDRDAIDRRDLESNFHPEALRLFAWDNFFDTLVIAAVGAR